VLHIELRKWAEVFVVAPLDANSLAKISVGISDNLLTTVARAWDFKKPMVVCAAMNTAMWDHPVTAKGLAILKEWGCIQVRLLILPFNSPLFPMPFRWLYTPLFPCPSCTPT
jgi:phosphopantothenoylcysteine decarboxylase